MEIQIEVEEALRRWNSLVRQVMDHGARVVLLHKGHFVGALVGPEDVAFLEQTREQRERERAQPMLN
jgi:hypothetical protein